MESTTVISTANNKIATMDYFKGFSILTIVLMHLIQSYVHSLPSFIKNAASFGGAGVHLFLFCSGMGLCYSYSRKQLAYNQFLKRRFLKIYFPYIVIVIISSFFPFMYASSDKIIAILSHIFLFKMFFSKYLYSLGGQMWFMSTIIQFYLIFVPLYILLKKIGDRMFIIATFSISLLWWTFISVFGLSNNLILSNCFIQYLWEFSLGMVFANYLYKYGKFEIKNKILILAIITCVPIMFLLSWHGGVAKNYNDVFSFFAYISIATLLWNNNFLVKLINFLNQISYEWYLVHILIFELVFKLANLFFINEFLFFILAFAISILIAYLYHLSINWVIKKTNN